MTYYSEIVALQDQLISVLDTNIAWLSGAVYKNTFRTNTSWPQAYVMPTSDQPKLLSLRAGRYNLRPGYAIVFQNLKSGTPETDRNILTSGTGAIMDQLKTFVTYYSSDVRWEQLEVENIDYEYTSPGVTPATIMESRIDVRLQLEW